MKKIIGLLLCGILVLGCFVGCGEDKVIKVVNERIEGYTESLIEQYVSDGSEVCADILSKIYKDTTVKYKYINIDDNTATVKISAKSKNFNVILSRAKDVAISNIDLVTPVDTLMNNAKWEIYDKEKPEEREVEIKLFKINDTWEIDPESVDDLVYLITGIRY